MVLNFQVNYERKIINMRDFAYTRTKPITRKAVILSALDAFIGGFILMLVVGMIIALLYMIVG